jgi:hypothetical protein
VSADGDQRGDLVCLEKEYANLGASDVREFCQLREQNAKLKRPVADLTLDKKVTSEIAYSGTGR